MKLLYRLFSLALCLCLVLTMVGCGKNYEDAYIYFELSEVPKVLDAQVASSDSELLIVRNIYEGLLRKNESGAIVYGACEDMDVNGLTYTFTIREDACWSTGEKLTAQDFVFALRRAVSPQTKAPFVSRLYSITNAKEIFEGRADASQLGVTAIDERTLVITLCREDKDFEETLTTSICMPCNEKFFEDSIGKYGLESAYINSNGSYRITKWNKEEFGIRLYKNEEYTGEYEAQNAAVFISCNDEETPLELLKKNSVDGAFLPNDELGAAKKSGMQIKSFENICWVMTVSNDYPSDVRKALMMLRSESIYSDYLPDGFSAADTIYPSVLKNVDPSVKGAGVVGYDVDTAKTVFSSAVSQMEDKKFPASTLYYYDDELIKPAITALMGHWQQNVSAFVNIKPSDSLDALKNELNDRTLAFAVFPITARNGSVAEYLQNFGKEDGDPSAIQQELLKNHTLVPFAFESTNLAFTEALENISTEPQNGYIDFSFIRKYE